MIRIVYLFLVFTAMNVFAQVPYITQLKGKVTTDFSVLEGVYVINKTTEKVSVTNQDGSFIIRASIGDTLLFSAMQFRETKILLTQKDFEKKCLL